MSRRGASSVGPRRPRGTLAAVVATGVLAVGFVAAALLASGDDPGGAPASREPQGASTTSESGATEASAPAVDGAALNDEGFARLQAGDYAGALPLLRAAVVALNGTNVLTEAYASYNLAFARFATGRCDGVVGLLDRSERIQGKRKEIDELRRQWEARCATGARATRTRAGRQERATAAGRTRRERGVGASYAWARSRAISPSSGKRPLTCLENTTASSTTTSNCERAPGVAVAETPGISESSPARLAARVS